MTHPFKLLILALFIITLTPIVSAQKTPSWGYKNTTISGKQIRYMSVPRNSDYTVVASTSNSGASLKSLINQVGGIAGINGAYFIPRDYTKLPDSTNAPRISGGDMKTFSRFAPDTGANVLFGWDNTGEPLVVQNNIWGESLLRQNYNSGSLLQMQSGIGNFPALLINGKDTLPLYQNTSFITPKMSGRSNKSFICFTK